MKESDVLVNFPSIEELMKVSFQKYENLPKTGKPNLKNEWTVLSTIVQFNAKTKALEVVALGTGTKCIGQKQLCKNGIILNDSHAEIIARRTFMRYIYEKIVQYKDSANENDIFVYNEVGCRFQLQDFISYHFFSSHPPCGDAAIITSEENTSDECTEPLFKKPKIELDENIIYTGAKILESSADAMNQQAGAIRLKPGRGDKTLSMSCSDKISRWNILGIQGALLDSLLYKPIYLQTFNFCGNSNILSIRRAFFGRWENKNFETIRFQKHVPELRVCNKTVFKYGFVEDKNPSPTSISWSNVPESKISLQVSVAGKKQGITKKKSMNKDAATAISKLKLFELYRNVLLIYPNIFKSSLFGDSDDRVSYLMCKKSSTNYQTAWEIAKKDYFCKWTEKPNNLLDFEIN